MDQTRNNRKKIIKKFPYGSCSCRVHRQIKCFYFWKKIVPPYAFCKPEIHMTDLKFGVALPVSFFHTPPFLGRVQQNQTRSAYTHHLYSPTHGLLIDCDAECLAAKCNVY